MSISSEKKFGDFRHLSGFSSFFHVIKVEIEKSEILRAKDNILLHLTKKVLFYLKNSVRNLTSRKIIFYKKATLSVHKGSFRLVKNDKQKYEFHNISYFLLVSQISAQYNFQLIQKGKKDLSCVTEEYLFEIGRAPSLGSHHFSTNERLAAPT